jgi:hypothetical protein
MAARQLKHAMDIEIEQIPGQLYSKIGMNETWIFRAAFLPISIVNLVRCSWKNVRACFIAERYREGGCLPPVQVISLCFDCVRLRELEYPH